MTTSSSDTSNTSDTSDIGTNSEMITTEEAAKRLAVSVATLNRWRRTGQGPTFFRYPPGGTIRYLVTEVDAFIRESAVTAAPKQEITTRTLRQSG